MDKIKQVTMLLQSEECPIPGFELTKAKTGDDMLKVQVKPDGDRFSHTIRVYPNELTEIYIDRHFMAGNETINVDQVWKNHNSLHNGMLQLTKDLQTYLNKHKVNFSIY